MDFSNFEALERFVIDSFEKILNEDVSEMAKKKQKEMKQRHVYDAHDPQTYQRTYEFLEANETKKDKKQINNVWIWLYTPTTNAFMPSRHPSLSDGSNQNKNIPYWIQYGNGNSPIFSYGGRDFITPTISEIDKKIKSTVIRGFKKLGIDAY